MDLINIGAQLLMGKLGGNVDENSIVTALKKLLGNDDISSLVSKMMGNPDLQKIAASWIGSGENAKINVDQITKLFGNEKLSNFASQLGIDKDTAAESLADVLPQWVGESGGSSSLGAAGDIGSIAGLTQKLF